ncbi:hypothetical protein Tco_0965185 [Tanacetum coccineum]
MSEGSKSGSSNSNDGGVDQSNLMSDSAARMKRLDRTTAGQIVQPNRAVRVPINVVSSSVNVLVENMIGSLDEELQAIGNDETRNVESVGQYSMLSTEVIGRLNTVTGFPTEVTSNTNTLTGKLPTPCPDVVINTVSAVPMSPSKTRSEQGNGSSVNPTTTTGISSPTTWMFYKVVREIPSSQAKKGSEQVGNIHAMNNIPSSYAPLRL